MNGKSGLDSGNCCFMLPAYKCATQGTMKSITKAGITNNQQQTTNQSLMFCFLVMFNGASLKCIF